MKCLVQRVLQASVSVDAKEIAAISQGVLVFVGFSKQDTSEHVFKMVKMLLKLRLFGDEAGRMNLDVGAVGGDILLVSQFTLYGDCKKGTRPSYTQAAPADQARGLYDFFVERVMSDYQMGGVQSGQFQSKMAVSLVNDGPVTLLLEI